MNATAASIAGRAQTGDDGALRESRLAALRSKAQAHIDAERSLFSALELSDIEARYSSAHVAHLPFVRRPAGIKTLQELIGRYPRSNRAGCALLELARLSSGTVREQYLRQAIAAHSDAWFENGVQVGALARAMLAVDLAGVERFDEAERVAAELVSMFPGAVDDSGAELDDVLKSIKLLRGANRAGKAQANTGLQPATLAKPQGPTFRGSARARFDQSKGFVRRVRIPP
jgi:hypothetical protein